MMSALYGTLTIITTVDTIEHCNTQKAASIRSAGICICVYMNHNPTVSPKTTIMAEMSACICKAVLNTFCSPSIFPLPKANVMYRCVAEAIELLMKPNMATTPPTTL